MTELSVAKQNAVAAMIEATPEAALRKLAAALLSTPGARVEWIRGRILGELEDRRMRAAVFGPLTALFRRRTDGVRGPSFPAPVLAGLWRRVRDRQGALVAQAEEMILCGGEIDPQLLNQLCLSAAAALRDEPETVWLGLDPQTAEALAACFDLAPLAHRSAPMLAVWTGRPDPEADATLRLMMQDAAKISEDAAPRMLEILFANLGEAGLILRVISRMSGAGGEERFLAESEMSDFGERLLERLETAAEALEGFDPARADAAAATAVCGHLNSAAELMLQMEQSLELTADGVWGARVQTLKQRLGGTLTELTARCPRILDNALPMERTRGVGGTARMTPVLDARCEGPAIDQARLLMRLLGASKGAAGILGCAGRRSGLCETLEKRLSAYGDEMIEALNAGLGADEKRMAALAAICAEFLGHADAEVAARTLSRRLAATGATAAPSPRAA